MVDGQWTYFLEVEMIFLKHLGAKKISAANSPLSAPLRLENLSTAETLRSRGNRGD
jgi:hypothetical protein